MPKNVHPFAASGPAHLDWDEDQPSRTINIRGGGYTIAVYVERLLEGRVNPNVRETFLRSGRAAMSIFPLGSIRSIFMTVVDPHFRGEWAKIIERPESPFRKRMRITISSHRRRLKRLRPH